MGTGRTLSFPVFRNQSGCYLCVADNDLNVTVDASAYLEVHCKFKSVSCYCFVFVLLGVGSAGNYDPIFSQSITVFNAATQLLVPFFRALHRLVHP